jgi:hypothetical protein
LGEALLVIGRNELEPGIDTKVEGGMRLTGSVKGKSFIALILEGK